METNTNKKHGNTKYSFGEMVIDKKITIYCNPYSMKNALRAYNKKNGTAITVDWRSSDRGKCEIWRTA